MIRRPFWEWWNDLPVGSQTVGRGLVPSRIRKRAGDKPPRYGTLPTMTHIQSLSQKTILNLH